LQELGSELALPWAQAFRCRVFCCPFVCVALSGKGRLHFTLDKARVNGKLYVETLLLKLFQISDSVLPPGFIFQQDGAMIPLRRFDTMAKIRVIAGPLPYK